MRGNRKHDGTGTFSGSCLEGVEEEEVSPEGGGLVPGSKASPDREQVPATGVPPAELVGSPLRVRFPNIELPVNCVDIPNFDCSRIDLPNVPNSNVNVILTANLDFTPLPDFEVTASTALTVLRPLHLLGY